MANREMVSGQQVAIWNILKYDPGHPLIQIALAPFESDTRRAEYLRNFGLNHLPADAKLWIRAAEMLLVQK